MTATAVALAAADFDAFRSEAPRTDARIGTLLSLVLGGVASSGGIGAVGGLASRQHHAYIALALLVAAAVVIVAGLVMIVFLILPKMDGQLTPQSGGLHQVADLPDADAARRYYRSAAQDCLSHRAALAWSQAQSVTGRLFRFRHAGRVLMIGVLLAAGGFVALGWGW